MYYIDMGIDERLVKVFVKHGCQYRDRKAHRF